MKYYQKAVSTPGIPYYTYEEMQQDLAALQAEYPAFLQLHSAGKSVEGRDITEVILGNIESRFHILIQAIAAGEIAVLPDLDWRRATQCRTSLWEVPPVTLQPDVDFAAPYDFH